MPTAKLERGGLFPLVPDQAADWAFEWGWVDLLLVIARRGLAIVTCSPAHQRWLRWHLPWIYLPYHRYQTLICHCSLSIHLITLRLGAIVKVHLPIKANVTNKIVTSGSGRRSSSTRSPCALSHHCMAAKNASVPSESGKYSAPQPGVHFFPSKLVNFCTSARSLIIKRFGEIGICPASVPIRVSIVFAVSRILVFLSIYPRCGLTKSFQNLIVGALSNRSQSDQEKLFWAGYNLLRCRAIWTW